MAQAVYRLGPSLAARIDAEDAVSEMWLVALRRRFDIRPGDAGSTPRLLAFLSTTLLNVINHRLRTPSRRKREVQAPSFTSSGVQGIDTVQAAEITTVVTRAFRSEVGGLLASSLASLPEHDQVVIVLRGIEGLTNDEATQELGERPNTVAQRYRRALQKLRALMPGSVFDEMVDA
jgi:RNA polymerase sigma factor (sigma-70 family)